MPQNLRPTESRVIHTLRAPARHATAQVAPNLTPQFRSQYDAWLGGRRPRRRAATLRIRVSDREANLMCACMCVSECVSIWIRNPWSLFVVCYLNIKQWETHCTHHTQTQGQTHTRTPDTPSVDDKQKIHFTQTLVLFKSEIHIHGRTDRQQTTGDTRHRARPLCQDQAEACVPALCALSLLSLLTFHALLNGVWLNIYHTLNSENSKCMKIWL